MSNLKIIAAGFALSISVLKLGAQTTSYKFDFGPGPVKAGYTQVLASTLYNTTRGYGWDFRFPQPTCMDRSGADSLLSDLCFNGNLFYFSVVLSEGNYNVSVTLGDPAAATTNTLKAESRRLFFHNVQTPSGQFVTRTFTVNRRNTAITGGGTVGITTREAAGLNWDGNKLTFEFNGARPSVASMEITPAVNPIQVFLAGNSTMCDWATETEAAWGQMVPRFFKQGAVITSIAESGLTTSAFISQNRLSKINSLMKAGDYLFAEFAHNDMKTLTLTTYQTNLRNFIHTARLKSTTPVFVSPTARRQFDSSGQERANSFIGTGTAGAAGVGDFLATFKQVAADSNVTLIDLNACSAAIVRTLGLAGSLPLYWDSVTHFTDYGAYEMARCVVEGVRTKLPALATYLTDDVTPFDPTHPDSDPLIPLSADTSVWHSAPAVVGIGKVGSSTGDNLLWGPTEGRDFYLPDGSIRLTPSRNTLGSGKRLKTTTSSSSKSKK